MFAVRRDCEAGLGARLNTCVAGPREPAHRTPEVPLRKPTSRRGTENDGGQAPFHRVRRGELGRSEFRRQVAVDLKADANLHENRRRPGHRILRSRLPLFATAVLTSAYTVESAAQAIIAQIWRDWQRPPTIAAFPKSGIPPPCPIGGLKKSAAAERIAPGPVCACRSRGRHHQRGRAAGFDAAYCCRGGTIISAQPAAALAALPVPSRSRRQGWRGLWQSRSVRVQLLLVFVLIDLVAVFIAGAVAILRARAQTRVEMAASMRLAGLLVGDAVTLLRQALPAEQFLTVLPAQLRSMRHVRITVKDGKSDPILAPLSGAAGQGPDIHAPAPAWFAALVAPPTEIVDVPVMVEGEKLGEVEIVGEPADEIAEVWQNMVVIGGVAVALNVAVVGILYVLFGRVLNPLTALASALSDLERQSYNVRLPPPQARELFVLTSHFNSLAVALETARTENLQLNRRLITAQDDERRRTALELHDEVGPCLFGLKANASSIASTARQLPDKPRQTVSERLREMLTIVDHLQAINRSMLDRLRPMALGHVPLKEVLRQLVHDRARQNPQMSFAFIADELLHSYGDSIDLTLYRCIQEGLTNAIRHGQASTVSVKLGCEQPEGPLALTVSDDGCGISPDAPAGLGMRGMRERVEGLGGRYVVDSGPGRGTCLRITIPLAEPQDGGTDMKPWNGTQA